MNAQLRHPAFVTLHEVWWDAECGYLVMERLEGSNLAQILADEPALDPPAACRIALEAAEALAHAHAQGFVHGDLKPSNLFLQRDGRLRILDLGLARRVDPLETQSDAVSCGRLPGTLAYMAPEQLQGLAAGPRSDIYSLGLVLGEMLSTDRSTHAQLTSLQLAHERLHGNLLLDLDTSTPQPLARLVSRMTRRDASQRFTSMKHVAEELRQFLGEPAPLAPGVAAYSAWMRGARLAAAGLIVALLPGSWEGQAVPTASPWTSVMSELRRAEDLIAAYDEPGALEEAARRLESVLAREPGNAAAAASLAIDYCLQYTGDGLDPVWLRKAEGAADLALKNDDQLARAYVARGWVRDIQDSREAAESDYRRALVLDPGDVFALNRLSKLLIRTQRKPEAASALEQALARFPNERIFLDGMGALLFSQGDLAGAERLFRRSIDAKPTGVYGYANLAGVLLHEGKTYDALAVLQQGLRVRPHGNLYNNLGTILFSQGRYAEAADAFERALSSAKGRPNDSLKWANLADALRWVPGREEDAKAAYRRALELMKLDPADSDATAASRAAVYAARLGDARVSQWIATALRAAPKAPEVRFRVALAYAALGRGDDALEELGAAVALGYPAHLIESEPDFHSLRRDRRYHQIMSRRSPS
jgi:serine/threonine-protein kinase